MTEQPFTDEQRAELEQMIHDAIAPVARQVTEWVQRERARLSDPRRPAIGTPVRARPPARPTPTPEKPPPADSEPGVWVLGDPHPED